MGFQHILDVHLVFTVPADLLCEHSGGVGILCWKAYQRSISPGILREFDTELLPSLFVINDERCKAPLDILKAGLHRYHFRSLAWFLSHGHARSNERERRFWFPRDWDVADIFQCLHLCLIHTIGENTIGCQESSNDGRKFTSSYLIEFRVELIN